VAESLKVLVLAAGCILCAQSIAHTLDEVSGRRWLDIGAALDRDGLWHLGPFELPIPEVTLSDPATFHASCGTTCHERGK
jgi:hypothetical protein